MTQRSLTITLQPDWKAAIRAVGVAAKADTYQGEVLNFETPAQFFGHLSEKRWRVLPLHIHAHRHVLAGCLSF